eukprot:jgi/Mesvir1/28506/Mv06275-RA.1
MDVQFARTCTEIQGNLLKARPGDNWTGLLPNERTGTRRESALLADPPHSRNRKKLGSPSQPHVEFPTHYFIQGMWSQTTAELSLGVVSRNLISPLSPSTFEGRSLAIRDCVRRHTAGSNGALRSGNFDRTKIGAVCRQKRALQTKDPKSARQLVIPGNLGPNSRQTTTTSRYLPGEEQESRCLEEKPRNHDGHSVDFDAYRALVLDVSYKPVDVMSWQRAIVLGLYEKAEVLSYYSVKVRSATQSFPLPAVIKTHIYLGIGDGPQSIRVPLSRGNVLRRDGYTCQYCGVQKDLTIDHLIPQSKGGDWSWENLVTACARCNVKKGDKSLHEAGLVLHKHPKEPAFHGLITATNKTPSGPHALPQEWQAYLPPSTNSAFELGFQL